MFDGARRRRRRRRGQAKPSSAASATSAFSLNGINDNRARSNSITITKMADQQKQSSMTWLVMVNAILYVLSGVTQVRGFITYLLRN